MDDLKITERQYEIIIRQAIENLPRESGGFLGGSEDMIKAVLPMYNKTVGDSTHTFTLESDDILRAHQFFEKHGLEYYGVYHSHPKGLPEPSNQDLRNIQKLMFIIGLANPEDPILNAFEISGQNYIRIPIKIVANSGVTVLDLKANQNKVSQTVFYKEAIKLHQMYTDIINEKVRYQKLAPINPFQKNSQFSTFA